MSLSAPCVEDLRDRARRRLPKPVFDFIDGGADREETLGRNRADLRDITFSPRAFVDVGQRSLAAIILGAPARMPFIIAPTGLAALACPRADVLLAKAARAHGVPFVISTSSSMRIEDIAADASGGRLWFQAYLYRDRELVQALIKRAAAAGCEALVVTVDTPVLGSRRRDARNGFSVPLRPRLGLLVDMVRCWRWSLGIARHGVPRMQNFVDGGQVRSIESLAALMTRNLNPSATWGDFAWIRQEWSGKLVVKGILNSSDAEKALKSGADAVWVSNHGGRQLDGACSSITALAEIRSALGDSAELIVDGGVSSGIDIAKCVAAGANAAASGRAFLFGLAALGESGAHRVLEIIETELDRTLALVGCPNIAGLNASYLGPRSTR